MIILHIARLTTDKTSGVSVVVPQHVNAQRNYASVKLLDINNSQKGDFVLPFSGLDSFLDTIEKPYNSPDLVVIHEVNNIENIKISKELRKRHIPYIVVPHGELTKIAQQNKWLKKRIAYLLLFNRFLKNAIGIQFLTEYEKESSLFKRLGFVSPNGISIPSNKKSFSNSGFKFLYIGRINVHTKGLDLLIKAVGTMQEYCRKNKISFALYGKRYNNPDFINNNRITEELISQNNVNDIVSLNDTVFGVEKETLLNNADMFIQTSRSEGMPMGVLEALAYGVPCLLSKGTRLGYEVDKNGAGYCVYEEESPESIANAIVKAYEEKSLLQVMSANAKKTAEKYDWDSVAQRTLKQYSDVVKK